VEPGRLPHQHQLLTLDRRGPCLRQTKHQTVKAASVSAPERQDDLLTVGADLLTGHVQHLDALADVRHAFRADQNHLVRDLRAKHPVNPRRHQRLLLVAARGAREMVTGARQPLAGEERDDLSRLSVFETERGGQQ
jgi:hypothetical protein